MDNFEDIRYDLARRIGPDVAFVNADAPAAHLDGAEFIFSFAGLVIISYCSGLIEAVAKDLGEKTWSTIRSKVENLLKRGPQEPVSKDQEEVEREVFVYFREAVVYMRERGQDADGDSGRRAAKASAKKYLEAHNFPPVKALELSEDLDKKLGE